MKAVRMTAIGQPLALQEIPVPSVGPGEVLVKIKAAGICHSDAHYRAGTSSTGPLPRWWSIGIVQGTAASAELQTTADSDTAVREADGSVTITAATAPQQGNWLKAPAQRRFTLLYSALAETARPLAPPFSVERGVCS